MKLVHAADLHLDSPLRGLERYDGAPVERMRRATRHAFENLVDLCLEEGVALLLLAGDLYDGNWRDYSTGLFFAAQITRLREGGVQVVWIRGNHDAASQITRHLRLPDNAVELPTRAPQTLRLEHLGIAVHGQGFAERAVTDDLAAAYPHAVEGLLNVGLLHTCASGRPGHDSYAPCRLETLADKGYDYWALGHVHQREVLSQAPWVVFPGNLQGRHARETGAKGATLIEVEAGRIARVEHRELDAVRWAVAEVDASDAASPDDVVDLARARIAAEATAAEGRPLAARVVVRGTTRAHEALQSEPERWQQTLRAQATDLAGEGVWLEKIRFATHASLDLAELSRRDDAVGQIVRSLRDLRADDARRTALLDAFADLRRKLPAALREQDEGLRLEDSGALAAALDDVEQRILLRLLTRGSS